MIQRYLGVIYRGKELSLECFMFKGIRDQISESLINGTEYRIIKNINVFHLYVNSQMQP